APAAMRRPARAGRRPGAVRVRGRIARPDPAARRPVDGRRRRRPRAGRDAARGDRAPRARARRPRRVRRLHPARLYRRGRGRAGQKTLEHIVDTVLYVEGETTLDHRILRAVKNRFGSVDEIGVFEMTGAGLVPVADPAAAFLAGRTTGVSGSAVTALMEGTRPLLVEIQALASRTGFGTPQRVATGLDHRRLAVLLAVLERRRGGGGRQGFRGGFLSARSRVATTGLEGVGMDGIGELARRLAA